MFLKVKLIHFLILICVCIMTNIAMWCSATLIRLCRLVFPFLFVFDCNQRCSVFVFQFVYLYFHLCICISICDYHLQYCCAALIRLCRLGQRCQNFLEFFPIFSQNRNTLRTAFSIFTIFAIFSLKPNTLLIFTVFSQNRNTLRTTLRKTHNPKHILEAITQALWEVKTILFFLYFVEH